ncbi:MAG: hypothetical protein ACRYFE_10235 [Janthinobacterium lividum]
MLSRRLWAGLAAGAGLGLLLAGASIGAWWMLDGRHRPVQITGDAAAAQGAIEGAPYVALNSGVRPVTLIGPRDNAVFDQWARQEAVQLAAQGREVRVITIPSGYGGAAEEATVAQMWLEPSKTLFDEWMGRRAELWTAAGLTPVGRDPLRQEALARAKGFATEISDLVGAQNRWPLVFWHDPAGALALCVCDTQQSQAKARLTLGLGGQAERVASPEEAVAVAAPVEAQPVSYPYPQGLTPPIGAVTEAYNEPVSELYEPAPERTPSPRLPGDPLPVVTAPPATAPVTRVPAAPTAPRQRPTPRQVDTAPPVARKDTEALFY